MKTVSQIDEALSNWQAPLDLRQGADELLSFAELVLEIYLVAQGKKPTHIKSEGFRLLGLHRQGAKGDPSFNACRETCREAVYNYNLICENPKGENAATNIVKMRRVVQHIALFIGGKMQVAGLGEFCCASKPIRLLEL